MTGSAIIVCSAKAGISVGAEKAWKYCENQALPRLLYISKTDEDNSDYNAALLRERLRQEHRPVVAPHLGREQEGYRHHRRTAQAGSEFNATGGRVEIEVPENKHPVL